MLPSRKHIKEIGPDIIHGLNVIESGLPVVFSRGCPKIVSILGDEIFSELVVYKMLTKIVFKEVNVIHSVSENLTLKAIDLGADKRRIPAICHVPTQITATHIT